MELSKLSMGQLKQQYLAVKAELDNAKKNLASIKAELDNQLEPLLNDYGTTHRIIDGVKLKLVKAKNIEWDSEKLAGLYARIKSDGADPTAYIKRKETFTVSENEYKQWSDELYKQWSDELRGAFDCARTEKEAKFTFEFEGDAE